MTANTCEFCSKSHPMMIEGPHWTGSEYVRVPVCNDCHAEGKLASAPRTPRKRRARVVVATDWNMLAAFSQKPKGRKS